MEFTTDQKKVITIRNHNVLVSAAAGSGKTAVLVERILGLVTDKEHPVDIDRMLVVTFTNAAAAEMRERLQRAILERLEKKVDTIAIEVMELTAWKNRIMGIFIGISMCGALVVDKLREFFFN